MRRRPAWQQMPDGVRRLIEERLGSAVVGSQSHDGGYSPGPASTLTTAGGDSVFIKAADAAAHPDAARMHRREAEIAPLLPAGLPTPAFRWVLEDGEWVVLAFDAVVGRHPQVPWAGPEVDAVARVIREIASQPAPDGLSALADQHGFDGWRRLAGSGEDLAGYPEWASIRRDHLAEWESGWPQAVDGDRLVHMDLRGDNVLISPAGAAVVVDWPHAVRGAGFCDLMGWLPALALEGGPRPQDMLARSLPAGSDPDAVTAFLVAITGYFVHASLQPDPPGIPHLRSFQRAQAEVCLPWLRERLGW